MQPESPIKLPSPQYLKKDIPVQESTLHKVTCDFTGIVRRREADGFGEVEFRSPPALCGQTFCFTREVLQNPAIARTCIVGSAVEGRARQGPDPDGWKIIRLEPFGGLKSSKPDQSSLWHRFCHYFTR